MNPLWITIRLVITGVMIGIGGLALYAAYLVAGTAPPTAVALLVFLGLMIGPGFYFMLTLSAWRMTDTGATPGPLIAWCLAPQHSLQLMRGFVVVLVGGMGLLLFELRRGDDSREAAEAYEHAVQDTLFDACWSRAAQAFRGPSAVSGIKLESRMINHCTCIDITVEQEYTPAQFAAVPKDRWWQGGDAKFDHVVQECRLYDSSFVRATRLMRDKGDDPDSAAMRPKILAYEACVQVELKTGYTPAELMAVSPDPAAQDGDAKFRDIVARCRTRQGW
jgi:hypothetical protein